MSNTLFQFSFYERARKQIEDEEDLNGRGPSLAFDIAYKWFEGLVLSVDSMPNCGAKNPALMSNQNGSVSNLQRAVVTETFAGENYVFIQPVESPITKCEHWIHG